MTTTSTASSAPTADLTTRAGSLGHQPALDGLRAVAVIAVLIFHNSWASGEANWLSGGYLGVDVFFVLSGFLITGILLSQRDRTGTTISRTFWYRRTRRLLPAMLLMLVIVSVYTALRAEPWMLNTTRWRSVATLAYVENWYAILAHPLPAPVSHMWSLSIEEQWYFVWPFLLAVLIPLTRGRRAVLGLALGALALLSAGLMAHYSEVGDVTRAYESTFGRAGELLVGALLAVCLQRGHVVRARAARIAIELGGIASAAWIAWCFGAVNITTPWMFRGGMYAVAIATAFVVLAAIQPSSVVLRPVLSWRPLVAVGLISYGLYLFNIPIYIWLDHRTTGLGPIALSGLRFATVFLIAFASYRLLEQPFRNGAFRGRGHWLAVGGSLAVLVVILVCTVGGRPQRQWEMQRDAFAAHFARHEGDPRLLVVGEGDALALSTADRQGAVTRGVSMAFVAAPACAISGSVAVFGSALAPAPRCVPWPDAFRAGTGFIPDATILMAGPSALLDHNIGGTTLRVGTPEYAAELTRRLEVARRTLVGARGHLIVTTLPCLVADPGLGTIARLLEDPSRRSWANGVWRAWADRHRDTVTLVDLDPILCPNGDPRSVGPHGPLREPNGVLTAAGMRRLRTFLVQQSGLAPR